MIKQGAATVMEYEGNSISRHHPVRNLFHGVTDRALSQSSLPDQDVLDYLTELLMHFINVNHLYELKDKDGNSLEYLVDMCEGVSETPRS